ncbi:hypothetical protein PI124_g24540 [Phytophthora idaei]|nr:hypothetical protein PI125_g26977 [Phytophthora idaei]KAG3230362.1 hypothetical protein PI124_g24540 [Phytophthora idaei]
MLTTNGLIEEHAPKSGQIHVLVVIPKLLGKRTRVDGDDGLSVQSKKRKVGDEDNGDDRVLRYFTMAGFPPLEHPRTLCKMIMERDSYIVIFRELMRKVKMCFKDKSDSNMVVTGNPGTGKSRFYLYCIFQLIRCHRVEVQELTTRGRVLRLTDGTSSMLCGWHGVSILFAAPDTPRMNNYAKVESFKYITPAWSLEELQDYNSLLSDKLELPDDVLISRYKKFGGIPRYIFTWTSVEM